MTRASNERPSDCQVIISGYSCRLPGAPDAQAFWALLEAGQSAIRDVPSSRWDTDRFYHPERGMPGKMHVKSAGLIEGVWDFDPGFFAISPREATEIDPQQRLMLEVVWESIEHGKLIPAGLAGPRTGVFVGASACDNSISAMEAPGAIGANFMTGNTMSILSNRISHQLDLHGPSYTIDTACSSSLYALHQAVGALQRDEIDTAIVAAVNLILSPFPFIGFSRAAMLSPDGRCKAFDASANGYVRGEGCVAFVLRRGDRMEPAEPKRGEVLATGIASAGKTVGISMPSEAAQAALLTDVYHRNAIDPSALAFVEAHGTGTAVGDPIEASALGRVLGTRRVEPLRIGSAKTNVGHLEACSGLVGLLKAQLALEHGMLPKSLHCEAPNPRIDFEALNLRVQQEASPLAATQMPALAGINSFGFGGANAHVVLREGPKDREAPLPPGSAPLLLTAASKISLSLLARQWKNRLDNVPCHEANALVAEAAHGRTRLAYRAVLAPEDGTLMDQLQSLADDKPVSDIQIGHAPEREGLTAFVFCGNGAQWAGMGAELYRSDPTFAQGFDRASDAYLSVSGLCLSELLLSDYSDSLDDGLVAQPLLFALQVALVHALGDAGLRPDAVAGHSVGEVAAAWSAGCISLDDASRLIHARATAMGPLRGRGTMAAVLADAETAQDAILEMGLHALVVAADNSPRSCTVSGPNDQVAKFVKGARRRRIAAQKLPVDYPYHGPALDQIEADLVERLGDVVPGAGDIPYVSATLGGEIAGAGLTADYWWRNARQPVRFREAVSTLCEIGATTFVEIGPRPLLQSYVANTAKAIGRKVSSIATLDKSAAAGTEIRTLISKAIAHGAREKTDMFFGPRPQVSGDLPAYPWDRAQYRAPRARDQPDLLGRRPGHPLLGAQLRVGDRVWQSEIDALRLPWLADHRVDGVPVLPAAAFAEMALAAGVETHGHGVELKDFDLIAPLPLQSREDATTTVRTSLEAETGIVRIESKPYPCLSPLKLCQYLSGMGGIKGGSEAIFG
ncbi:MAG: type I polyketide synthase [Pseudomonadota bacterium]